jgi:hypothetical protein
MDRAYRDDGMIDFERDPSTAKGVMRGIRTINRGRSVPVLNPFLDRDGMLLEFSDSRTIAEVHDNPLPRRQRG